MKNSNLLNRLLSYSHEKQSPQRFARYAAMLLLLAMCVTYAWADEGSFYNMYLSYTFEGSGGSVSGNDGNTGVTVDAGTLTSGSLILTGVYLKCYDDWGSNFKSSGGQLCYTNKGGSTQYVSCATRSGKNNGKYEYQNSNPGVTLASYDQASGSYAFESWGQTWDWDGGGNNGDWYFPYSSGHYVINYKIAPPAISSFSVSRSGYISGAGTSDNPYLVAYNGTLTLTVNGSKAHTDGNSTLKYWKDSGAKQESNVLTVSGITSTDLTSVVVHAQCINNSSSLLVGTESTETIYFKVPSYTVTLNDNGSYQGDGSATAIYGRDVLTIISTPSRTGHHVNNGYYYEPAMSNLVANTSGNLQANTSYTDSNGKWTSTSNQTLYAAWAANTYTVEFDKNGGTGSISNQDFTYGVEQALTLNDGSITRDGYFFDGWAESPEGAKVYDDGESVSNLTETQGGTVTLYAHWKHAPVVASVTAEPEDDKYNYVGSDITLNLEATSTYLEHPIVVFYVHDGIGTYQVTAAAYGDGDDAVGTIGAVGDNYETVHKATYTVNAAGTYSVTAKLYEGVLVDNFEGGLNTTWTKDNLGTNGSVTTNAANPSRMANNGSSKVLAVDRTGGTAAGGAIMLFVATADDKDDCDPSGSNDYAYIHARMKDATSATKLQNNTHSGDDGDITPTFDGSTSSDWRHVTYHNTHCSNNFLLFKVQTGDTDDKTIYIDDIILSNNATWAPVKDEKNADVKADASEVVINQTYDITIVGGHVTALSDETETKASANVANPLAGTADVTAADFETRMKFTGWKLSAGISLKDGYVLTDHSIQFYARGNGTVTAQFAERNYVHVYFDSVPGWTETWAYAWQSDSTANENASYPGVKLTLSSVYDGVKYFYYGYYTESKGLGDAAPDGKTWEDIAKWDRIIFNKGAGSTTAYPGSGSGWNKTKDLTLVNGHFYHFADADSGSEYYYDWYVMGKWNGAATWDYSHPIDYSNSTIIRDLTVDEEQTFKIYRASTDEWFKYDPDNDGADEKDEAVVGSEMTLKKGVPNDNAFTPDATAGYRFTLVKDNTSPRLTIDKLEDQDVTVTVETSANGSVTSGTGSTTIHLYTTTALTAVADAGYRFEKWTVDAAHKGYIHIEDTTSASTKVYAKYERLAAGATITAHFTNKDFIYFDRSAVSWPGTDVYVTFFKNNDHWEDYWTPGSDHKEGNRVKMQNWVAGLMNQQMNRIGETNIYYLDTKGLATPWFMFTHKSMKNGDTTWEQGAVARADFSSASGCNLFIVENWVEKTVAYTGYYVGYWMKYREEEAGVKLCIYDGSNQHLYGSPFTFTHEDVNTNTFSTTVNLNGSSTYRMELLGDNGIYYKHNTTYTTVNADANPPYKNYVEREKTSGYITTTGEGKYTFNLICKDSLNMSTVYPLKAGDYRIVYHGRFNTDSLVARDFNTAPIAKWKTGDETKIDSISFFVIDTAEAGNTMDWNLRVQKCSFDGATVSWSDVTPAKEFSFTALKEDTGVYVFAVKQTSASDITIENPVKYTGDYYIRTDIADGRWEAYKEAENNKMGYSEWAEKHSDYNYYHCHYTPSGKSVKFTIANDYSSSISGEMNADSYTSGDGKLAANANVRFGYNSATNVIKRTYIGGSSEATYLNIVSPNAAYIYTANGVTDLKGASADTCKFVDMGNWVYQKDIKAYPGAQAKVTAYYNGSTQYLIGSSTTNETIIGGTKGEDRYKLRTVYDFKNNHLITSWLADGAEIGSSITLNADLMIVRRLQNAGVQIQFSDADKSISGINTIYGAIQFDYNDMVDQMPDWRATTYGKAIYYISFPFDVNVKDIFGSAGNMEDQWIIQTYNGARRAEEGWFADSKPFWETLTVDSVMRAGQGYVLIIDRPSFNDASSVVWTNKSAGSSVYLYFPSHNANALTIGTGTKTVTVPPHKCNIDRWFQNSSTDWVNHKETDSHWNMMGIPVFKNVAASNVVVDSTGFNYFYDWDAGTNTYITTIATSNPFKAMHGYMVQFTGKVTFNGVTLKTPVAIAARQVPDNKQYVVELRMTDENDIFSRTYVELRENACDTFQLNEDMYMMRSSQTVDLYTLAGNYDVAANVLSIQNHTVPVEMDVKKAGTYTFSMPTYFSGTVTLIDTQTGARTNLAVEDYQVYLNKGLVNGRFFLEMNIEDTTTSLEEISGEGSLKDGKAHKFLQNGAMYILKEGVIYDARGNRVK